MNRFHALIASLAASAVLARCAGVGIPGFGDSSGCRTVYVYRTNGGIQPISNCGGLPRDTLMAQGCSHRISCIWTFSFFTISNHYSVRLLPIIL
jgi:hypothetical protein